ncbi:MAG TPA: hypothetical protein VF595_11495 [Tepidisphaeraceae bacterium]
MTTRVSASRTASARIEALEQRSLFSGEIDHSFGAFGSNGLVTLPTAEKSLHYSAARPPLTTVQADGKIIVAGSDRTTAGTLIVTRYQANGLIDTTFGNGGSLVIQGAKADRLNAVNVLSDGKILLQGQYYYRLTADGQLDRTFSGDGFVPSVLAGDRRVGPTNATAVTPDGGFLELQSAVNGRSGLFKYKADGSIDKTYGNSGSFNVGALNTGYADSFKVGGVVTDAQSRAYVSFIIVDEDGANLPRVARLTAAGKIDPTYGTNGVAQANNFYDVGLTGPLAVMTDGRVVVGINFDGPGQGGEGVTLLSFDAAGKTQNAFYVDAGIFSDDRLVAGPDNTLYVGGSYSEGDNYQLRGGRSYAAVIHLTKDFKLDTKFSADRDGVAGYGTNGYTEGGNFALAPNGDILVVGSHYTDNSASMAKLTSVSKPTYVTYSRVGGRLTVSGSSGGDRIIAGTAGDDDESFRSGKLFVRLDATTAGTGLFSADVLEFNDSESYGTTPVTELVFNLYGGNDVFSGVALRQNVYVNGNAGDDSLSGGFGQDTLIGGTGNDVLIGDGSDVLQQ